jgi:hypothetical protein
MQNPVKLAIFFVFFFSSSVQAEHKNLVRFYFMPTAPVKIRWDSPRVLLGDTLRAVLMNPNHPIGHVNIEVVCEGREPLLAGAVSADKSMSGKLLLNDQLAFAILERSWPGRLESEKEITDSIAERLPHAGRLSAATFLVSPAACHRALEFYKGYSEDGLPKYYGFGARPLYHEGAGCSAFAAAFAEAAGILSPALRARWTQERRVPLSLMKGHLGNKGTNVVSALASRASREWSDASIPHMLLEFYDPDLMHAWATELASSESARRDWGAEPDILLAQAFGRYADNVAAVRIDARALPLPTGPIFHGAPRLKRVEGGSVPSYVRTDISFRPDGSFDFRP